MECSGQVVRCVFRSTRYLHCIYSSYIIFLPVGKIHEYLGTIKLINVLEMIFISEKNHPNFRLNFTILDQKKSSRKENVLTRENIVRLKVYIFGWLIDSVEYVSAVGDLKGFDSVIGPIYDQHSFLCQNNVEVILIHLQIKPNQNCIVIIRLLLTNWIHVPFFLIKKKFTSEC